MVIDKAHFHSPLHVCRTDTCMRVLLYYLRSYCKELMKNSLMGGGGHSNSCGVYIILVICYIYPEFESLQSKKFFSSPKRSFELWRPPNNQFNRYGEPFPRIKQPGRELSTNYHLGRRLRMSGAKPSLLPHDCVEWTGTTLPSLVNK